MICKNCGACCRAHWREHNLINVEDLKRWLKEDRREILENICIEVEWKDKQKNLSRYIDCKRFLENLNKVEKYIIRLDRNTNNPNKLRSTCPFLKDYGDLRGECLIKDSKPRECLKYGSSCIWIPRKI
ncbi:MAG: hypothetical protein ACE5K4_07385 [Candidatus Hydrothermarchaeota archaeon]